MGIAKKNRLLKTTNQAKRVKKSNFRNVVKKRADVKMQQWNKNKSLIKNYNEMGILTDFDSTYDPELKKSSKTKGIRKNKTEDKNYEKKKMGYFQLKKQKQLKNEGGETFIEEFERKAQTPKAKRKRFNISMEEMQVIDNIIKTLSNFFILIYLSSSKIFDLYISSDLLFMKSVLT